MAEIENKTSVCVAIVIPISKMVLVCKFIQP